MSQRMKVQQIVENSKTWPYVGNAYFNKDGSLNVYLDKDKAVPTGAKLHLRPARGRQTQEQQPAEKTE